MSDEVDLSKTISRPQINIQDEESMLNIAMKCQQLVFEVSRHPITHLVSISAPVATSVITSLIQGGGVIGRRS